MTFPVVQTFTTAGPTEIRCEAQLDKHVVCGKLVAVRVLNGWEIICPRCKNKIVLLL